jgi:hypothetical protein
MQAKVLGSIISVVGKATIGIIESILSTFSEKGV